MKTVRLTLEQMAKLKLSKTEKENRDYLHDTVSNDVRIIGYFGENLEETKKHYGIAN